MSLLSNPSVAAGAARIMQSLMPLAKLARRGEPPFREFPGSTSDLTIPNSVAPATAVVYRPPGAVASPPVHVNFHGGGFVLPGAHLDDPLCRYLAAEAGVVVVNVEYAVAPQHRFPQPPHQAFEIGSTPKVSGTRNVCAGRARWPSIATCPAPTMPTT